MTSLVWFRRDLRLADHPALMSALARGGPVVPVFVLDDRPGAAAQWWLHHSLARLNDSLGGRLVLRAGRAEEELPRLAAETGARAVLWNRRAEPAERDRDSRVGQALTAMGVEARELPADLLFEPGRVLSREGRPLQVFTAWWRAALALPAPSPPLAAPAIIPFPDRLPPSTPLATLGLLPRIDWAGGLAQAWTPGEAGAQARLRTFLDRGLDSYAERRDLPGHDGTSRLSPHLAFGEISPRQLWHAIPSASPGAATFLKEVGWREFSYELLARHPDLPDQPLRREFARFPWDADETLIEAWRQGRTGYPIVDAGMRQLWAAGWMHNRVRMIAASFLVKHLLAPWTLGEAWFADTLVDGDAAVNAASWQWVAGCGADAAPYFRIFNPILQGEKFDPEGAYVRRWVPELAGVPRRLLHRPWEAGRPAPVVDHARVRARALAAYGRITGASPTPAA